LFLVCDQSLSGSRCVHNDKSLRAVVMTTYVDYDIHHPG